MHRIEPAELKPGVSVGDIRDSSRDAAVATDDRLIRGKALIFWDRKSATPKKLDAIDTDQITPAADCVSESLATLDERWKAGSFRYLMPDFRARVHSGQNFLIAGDRFAIGSSREMSPAGLKAVAEEATSRAPRSASASSSRRSASRSRRSSASSTCSCSAARRAASS